LLQQVAVAWEFDERTLILILVEEEQDHKQFVQSSVAELERFMEYLSLVIWQLLSLLNVDQNIDLV